MMYNWDMTELQKLPIDSSKTETIKILKAENKAVKMLAELKGCANLIPNQSILINAVVLQESKDSSEIENIITTKDNLYKAVSETVKKIDSATKEVMFYREALYTGFYQLKEDLYTWESLGNFKEVTTQSFSSLDEINNPVVVLSGPSHAEEVAFNIPTTVLTSSKDMKCAEEVQDLFMTKTFRVYTNDDLVGVEIGGAVKNIIALAAGVCDGLGYGDNTKAALMTRGMAEIVRIGTKLGGRIETFLGLTGMGDLIVTCTSMHSRNRKAGYLIGIGKSREEAVEEVEE